MKKFVLAINFGAHDTSSAISLNGKIIAACEEERFNKEKHTRQFPILSIKECLKISKIKLSDISEIALTIDHYKAIKKLYLQPAIQNENRFKFLLNDIDRIKKFNNIENIIRKQLNYDGKITKHEHHMCHLASTYYPSGFKRALLLSNDGIGENESGVLGLGYDGKIKKLENGPCYPHSLGLLYSAITFFLGWKHHCDEGIIMGLAPYGDPFSKVGKNKKKYIDYFRDIIKYKKNYSYEINLDWISYHQQRNTWISEKFIKIFGQPRKYKSNLSQHHKNIAAALQLRLEEVVIKILRYSKKKYKTNYLCIAGGVGLNCSLNGKIESLNLFKKIFVQPASGDNGTVLGACFLSSRNKKGFLAVKKRYNHYLGTKYSNSQILNYLKKNNIKFTKPQNHYDYIAEELKKGKVVAWFQNSAEFGPRALGNRSILCKPYPSRMKDHLNARVKFREYFRPFAPAVLDKFKKEYFKIKQNSEHMLIACQGTIKANREIPAVIHVDNSARVQTVTSNSNLDFYKLIHAFYKITNCPVLLNTSFNVKGQPMVNSVKDAVETFVSTNIDVLGIGPYVLKK